MKGLIYKDAVCLKKNLKTFIFVTLGVMAISIMFALSKEHGNIADGLANYDDTDTMDKALLISTIELAMHMILIIPMAFMANVVDCFKADNKSEFSKILFSAPVSYNSIVGARYISMLVYALVGLIFSVISAAGISAASSDLVFKEMLSVTLSFAGIMFIYMGIVMPCTYLFGANKSDLICGAPFVAAIVAAAVYIYTNGSFSGEMTDADFIKKIDELMKFLNTKGFIIIAAAALFLLITYFASVLIVEKKRGRGI